MISLEKLRKIDPETKHLADKEIESIRQEFYAFGQLVFEEWCDEKFGSKNPIGALNKIISDDNIKL